MPDERDTFAVMLSQLQMTIGWQYRASGSVESGAVFFAPVVERKTEGEAENHAVTRCASMTGFIGQKTWYIWFDEFR